eukprot:10925684-Lingulodinium_polyedra.AAC.1
MASRMVAHMSGKLPESSADPEVPTGPEGALVFQRWPPGPAKHSRARDTQAPQSSCPRQAAAN